MSHNQIERRFDKMHSFDQSSIPTLSNYEKGELLAKKIENKMKDFGLSRQDFAKLMDVQPSIITRWLSGKHNFTVATIYDIERKLNFRIIDLGSHLINTTISFHLTVQSPLTSIRNTEELVKPFLDLLSEHTLSNITPHLKNNEIPSLDENYNVSDQMLQMVTNNFNSFK